MNYLSYNKVIGFVALTICLMPFLVFASQFDYLLESKERIEFTPQSSDPLLTNNQKLIIFNAIQQFKNITIKNSITKISNLKFNRVIIPNKSFSYKKFQSSEKEILEKIYKIKRIASITFLIDFIK